MTDFKASVEFPDVNLSPSVGAIDQSKLTTGDVVYITKQQQVEIPAIHNFPLIEDQTKFAPQAKEVVITEFNSGIAVWANHYVSILRDNSGNTLLAYNGAAERYRVTFFDQSGNQVDIYREQGNEQHTAAYEQGNANVSITWVDDGSPTYRLGIWVNSNGQLLPLVGGEAMFEFPRYGGLYSGGFKDATLTLASNAVIEHTDANLVTYETVDTQVIDRTVVYSGEDLIDITTPLAVEYDADVTKVYHNQTLLVGTLTDDITVDVDNLATHFRVLYSEDAEVNHTISLSFRNDTFTLGYTDDDVTFTKFDDAFWLYGGTWFYTNKRNNEKGAF